MKREGSHDESCAILSDKKTWAMVISRPGITISHVSSRWYNTGRDRVGRGRWRHVRADDPAPVRHRVRTRGSANMYKPTPVASSPTISCRTLGKLVHQVSMTHYQKYCYRIHPIRSGSSRTATGPYIINSSRPESLLISVQLINSGFKLELPQFGFQNYQMWHPRS
jgi:hypothetical protein